MKVLYERCAGCDIHKKAVTVHVAVPEGGETRTFGTTTAELLEVVEWLLACRVTHVAMESTGVYWKPLYNLLEATGLTVFVVNAAHMKAVPGRKTDVQDAVWISDLMRHGLLKPSFIPPRPQRELRELVRYRISLIRERADEANRIQKVLEGGNIKLGSVVSEILGKSGRAILTAIAAGDQHTRRDDCPGRQPFAGDAGGIGRGAAGAAQRSPARAAPDATGPCPLP
jgi:transposase